MVGQALAAALEFQIAKKAKTEHERFQISARYIYYAARKAGGANMNIDAGATIKDGLKVLELEGAVKESVWPYRAGQFREEPPRDLDKAERFRITAVRQLHSLTDIQLALKDNEPVVAGIPVFKGITSAEATKTGIVPLPAAEEKFIGGHAIVIVGYDNESKRVQFANSWGKGWGVQGFGWLPYEYIEEHMSDAWTFKLAPE